MHWIAYLLISLPIAALGLVGGGFIGNACVRWYRVSSFSSSPVFARKAGPCAAPSAAWRATR
jgi:hypothetical protein